MQSEKTPEVHPQLTPLAEQPKQDVVTLLPCLLAFLVFVYSMLVSTVFDDPDTLMHLATGQWMLSHHAIVMVDPFSFNTPAIPWIDHEWLSQLILASADAVDGLVGIRILVACTFALTLGYQLQFLLARMPALYALLLSALSFIALLSHHLARPHLLTWPIVTLWFIGLIQAVEKGKGRAPFFLAPWMIVWANLHGGFILGLVLIPFFALESCAAIAAPERRKAFQSWGLFCLLSVGCAFLTPYGWHGIELGAHLMSSQAIERIIEWAPARSTDLLPLAFWLIVLLGITLSGYLRLSSMRWVLLVGFFYESLMHVRYTSMFGLVAPLLIAQSFGERYRLKRAKPETLMPPRMQPVIDPVSQMAVAPWGWVALAIAIVGVIVWAQGHQVNQLKPENTPREAIDYVTQAQIHGKVFNYYNMGGYLIYRHIPVFIDGRADLYGDQKVAEYYAIADVLDAAKTTQLLQDHGIAWTIFPPNQVMVSYLNSRPEWQKVYEDSNAVVHVKH